MSTKPATATNPVIGVAARVLSNYYTRSQMVNQFLEAGAVGEEPTGNKLDTAVAWLKASAAGHPQPLVFLGCLLRDVLEGTYLPATGDLERARADIHEKLASAGLRYTHGVVVSALSGATTKTLEDLLQRHDFPAVLDEFSRSTSRVDTEPREAASAAANLLEGICKEYIVQHPHLQMPAKADLRNVFTVVREDLGLDPTALEEDDLKRILGGLLTTVDGISALRTHASSAHTQGTSQRYYRLTPRHARRGWSGTYVARFHHRELAEQARTQTMTENALAQCLFNGLRVSSDCVQ